MPQHHDHASLKAYQRANREALPEHLALRVHRALSWLEKAETCADDPDAQFIFLWIAFNAAYSNELGRSISINETGKFTGFLSKLCQLDRNQALYNLVWEEFPGAIRQFLDNRYVYQPFWDFHNGEPGFEDWEDRFRKHQATAKRALGNVDTPRVLSIIFSGLYTLRNQLVHGGATWQSSVNRDQVRDGARIMSRITPALISLMMTNDQELWGEPCYPVVKT